MRTPTARPSAWASPQEVSATTVSTCTSSGKGTLAWYGCRSHRLPESAMPRSRGGVAPYGASFHPERGTTGLMGPVVRCDR